MPLKLFNTLTWKKEPFVPVNPDEIQFYTCGPSVYDAPHLGNYRTFIYEDVLKRMLLWNGYRVRHVMNITDLETKGIAAARRQKVEFWGLMKRNTKLFFSEMGEFRVLPADVYPLASKSVNEMADAVEKMIEKGYAYRYGGDVFFDVSKSKGYGELTHYKFTRKQLNRRVRLYDYWMHLAGDFLLWYRYRKSYGKIYWSTKLGKGIPSWNAECPALCTKYLRIPMDIHAGGFDNIFSHHENEMAQVKALTGKPLAKYWFHVEHLMTEGRKMSKSLKNYESLEELKKAGFSTGAIKWLLLSAPYRKKLNFTKEKLVEFERRFGEYRRVVNAIRRVRRCKTKHKFKPVLEQKRKLFFEAMNDNLDTRTAFRNALELVDEAEGRRRNGLLCKRCAKAFLRTIKEFDRATGAFPI